ncbi:MAG: DUF6090 family protein [Fidelibacterota bacterium]|jgi:hypothetical protein
MKNILTRGGIEFLAVLLGISGSLWIDNYSKEKEIHIALNQDISNIRLDIQQDLEEINIVDSLITEGLTRIDLFIKITNKEINIEEIDTTTFSRFGGFTNTFFPMGSSYLVAQNSGRINKIEDQKLLKSISKYYQNSYERLKTNNFMYDDFLNINYFTFRAELDSKKTDNEIIKLFESGIYEVLFIEWRNRRTSYRNYVLKDLKTSANQLLLDIDNYLSIIK